MNTKHNSWQSVLKLNSDCQRTEDEATDLLITCYIRDIHRKQRDCLMKITEVAQHVTVKTNTYTTYSIASHYTQTRPARDKMQAH